MVKLEQLIVGDITVVPAISIHNLWSPVRVSTRVATTATVVAVVLDSYPCRYLNVNVVLLKSFTDDKTVELAHSLAAAALLSNV